jgi:hypothetical protein
MWHCRRLANVTGRRLMSHQNTQHYAGSQASRLQSGSIILRWSKLTGGRTPQILALLIPVPTIPTSCERFRNQILLHRTGLLFQILIFVGPTFCPHTVFMCLVWISEQTAITTPSRSVIIPDRFLQKLCLLRGGTNWILIPSSSSFLLLLSFFFSSSSAVPWLRWLVAGLVRRRCGFDLRPGLVRLVVGRVALT